MLLSVKRICRCCSDRHLGQSLTRNFRSSQGPPVWKPPLLDELTSLGQRESAPAILASTRDSENCRSEQRTPSSVIMMRHILLTKCLVQAHSGVYKSDVHVGVCHIFKTKLLGISAVIELKLWVLKYVIKIRNNK